VRWSTRRNRWAGIQIKVHHVSNVDAWKFIYHLAIKRYRARTAFCGAEVERFTTQETMTLLASAKRWLLDGGCTSATDCIK
jgi:glucose-6-phosphate isomerase